MIASLLDLVLAVAVAWLAWMALSSRDLFRSVILYIVFGLLMSLAWVRLRAPDIALAEAAIGAGLTGALLLDAVAQLEQRRETGRAPGPGSLVGLLAALALLPLVGGLAASVLRLSREPGGLTQTVAENLTTSGVSHPVTAVLLNFRAIDTWLEVGVLLVAALTTLIVLRAHDFRQVPVSPSGDRLLAGLPRLIVPLMVLVGGYLLWLGTHAPGGAFQSGAVLASAGVLLLLAGHRSVAALRSGWLRAALLAGVLAFLLAAAGTLLLGSRLLEFSPARAGTVILVIETLVTISIAVTLAALFAGARGQRPAPHGQVPRSPA